MGQRYERKKDGRERAWEISLHGKKTTTVEELIDARGKTRRTTETLTWYDGTSAKAEYDRMIAGHVKAGYRLVREAEADDDGSSPKKTKKSAQEIELEANIRKNPDDPAPWLVYADWLTERSDPRGELIVVQEARARRPNERALARAEEDLFVKHHAAFFGDVDEDYIDTWRNGFFAAVTVKSEWNLRRSPVYSFDDEDEADDDSTCERLSEVLEHPSAKFLERLTIIGEGTNTYDYRPVISLLAARQNPAPPLRGFAIGDADDPSRCDLGELDQLLAAYPELRSIALNGRAAIQAKKSALFSKTLESISVVPVTPTIVQAIVRSDLPKLTRLSLWLGNTDVRELVPLFDRKKSPMPALVELRLRGSASSDAIAGLLADSALAKQIERLDLGRGTMTRFGVRALMKAAKEKKAFSRLKWIDLRKNYIDDDGRAELDGLAKDIIDDDQYAFTPVAPTGVSGEAIFQF